jgi:protein involved in polysaccharide export with SLBB domain
MKHHNIKAVVAIVISLLAICTAMVTAQSISANTTLNIEIKGVPASEQGMINGQYVVSSSGLVYMPLLKNGIRASGLSSSALARSIEQAYSKADIYDMPRITVISSKDQAAQNIDAQVVHVGGFVSGPGPKPYQRGMTIWQALTAAGGPNPFGSIKRVELHRNGKKYIYNLKDPKFMKLPVYPNDSINVPQKTVFGN